MQAHQVRRHPRRSALQTALYFALGALAVGAGTCVACSKLVGYSLDEAEERKTDAAAARATLVRDVLASAKSSHFYHSEIIVDAYEANEIAADEQFRGRWVVIGGIVDTLAKDISDKPYVTLRHAGRILGRIQCVFAPEAKTDGARLSKGESVRLVGTGKGKFGNVLFEDCMVVR